MCELQRIFPAIFSFSLPALIIYMWAIWIVKGETRGWWTWKCVLFSHRQSKIDNRREQGLTEKKQRKKWSGKWLMTFVSSTRASASLASTDSRVRLLVRWACYASCRCCCVRNRFKRILTPENILLLFRECFPSFLSWAFTSLFGVCMLSLCCSHFSLKLVGCWPFINENAI